MCSEQTLGSTLLSLCTQVIRCKFLVEFFSGRNSLNHFKFYQTQKSTQTWYVWFYLQMNSHFRHFNYFIRWIKYLSEALFHYLANYKLEKFTPGFFPIYPKIINLLSLCLSLLLKQEDLFYLPNEKIAFARNKVKLWRLMLFILFNSITFLFFG